MAAKPKVAAKSRRKKEAPASPPVADAKTALPLDVMPLDVMLGAMRELWGRAEELKGRPDCVEERLALIRQASGEAHKAAVYVHPRIASVDAEGDGGSVTAPQEVPRVLGSRELARRLLFAVAVAEYLPATETSSTDPDSKEKP